MLMLTLPPCAAFILYAQDRKNTLAIISAALFAVFHLIHALAYFII